MAKNDVTGDSLRTKPGTSEAYSDGWDRIFVKKKVVKNGCDNDECFCTGKCKKSEEEKTPES